MEEAVEWLKRAPFDGGTEVEIRQVYEASIFLPMSFLLRMRRASRRCATSCRRKRRSGRQAGVISEK